jgi:hypothetical protein
MEPSLCTRALTARSGWKVVRYAHEPPNNSIDRAFLGRAPAYKASSVPIAFIIHAPLVARRDPSGLAYPASAPIANPSQLNACVPIRTSRGRSAAGTAVLKPSLMRAPSTPPCLPPA